MLFEPDEYSVLKSLRKGAGIYFKNTPSSSTDAICLREILILHRHHNPDGEPSGPALPSE